MDTKTATNILIQAATIGQAKGAYDLQSAKMIALAVEILTPKPEPVVEPVVDEPKDGTPISA